MGAVGASHLGLGPELACFEAGRHGFPTPDFSDALLAHWHARVGLGPDGGFDCQCALAIQARKRFKS